MPDNKIVTEEEINLLLDGELTPAHRADIQGRLAINPPLAANVFAEAQRMESLCAAQPRRMFPPPASVAVARRLEGSFHRQRVFAMLRLQMAAVIVFALGWAASSLTSEFWNGGKRVDGNFILAAREALRVAQLDAGPDQGSEPSEDKIERLVGAINISMPKLPSLWRVTDVQVQPWNGKHSLVVTAETPSLGQITLVAAPMTGEDAVPLTSATDGRVPTVYWQSGGTAYALMGPAAPERLEHEAKQMEVATRRRASAKIRG
jgi:anti-sigma factor RsiW